MNHDRKDTQEAEVCKVKMTIRNLKGTRIGDVKRSAVMTSQGDLSRPNCLLFTPRGDNKKVKRGKDPSLL